jgi:hypothetical protein
MSSWELCTESGFPDNNRIRKSISDSLVEAFSKSSSLKRFAMLGLIQFGHMMREQKKAAYVETKRGALVD